MTQTTGARSKAFALLFAALFIITLVGLIFVITSYPSEMSAKNAQINQLNNQLNAVQEQIANLTSPALAPKLIGLGLQYIDNRTNPNAPFLLVTGYVVNVGTAKANNCSLYVNAIQNGNVTAINSCVAIDSLEPGTSETVSVQFPYTGSPLIAYCSNFQWQN